jgi:methyltransferase (TIGR00027 family)
MHFSNKHDWTWAARTYLFDAYVMEQIGKGVDMVVNLAAGLDARPYRLEIPQSLRWVEVDMPDLITYKEKLLSGEKPRCRLERVGLDLSQRAARKELFRRLGREARNALIITEGLIIYLTEDEVGNLASDLAATPAFRYWATDLASPGLLRILQKEMGARLSTAGAQLQFAPQAGTSFFPKFGWNLAEVRSLLKTAGKLKRLPFFLRLISFLPQTPGPRGSRPWSGICLFTTINQRSTQS